MDQQTQVDIDNQLGTVSILADGQNTTAAPPSHFTGTAVHLVTLVCAVSQGVSDALQHAPGVLVRDVLQIGSAVDPVRLSSTTSNGDDVSTEQNTAEVSTASQLYGLSYAMLAEVVPFPHDTIASVSSAHWIQGPAKIV